MKMRNIMPPEFESKDKTDLTPMIDVIFIILIFFIVTSSIDTFGLKKVKQPASDNSAPLPKQAEKVQVIHPLDGQYLELNGEKIHINALRARLKQVSKESRVIINAEADTSAATLVQLMDEAEAAGLKDISLAVRKK